MPARLMLAGAAQFFRCASQASTSFIRPVSYGGHHMKASRTLVALTMLNVALCLISLSVQLRPAFADRSPAVLRGSALQIIDGQGRIRASIDVLPASTSPNGEEHAETVLLRLITERGRPSVKIGSSEPASGMSLAGPTGTS